MVEVRSERASQDGFVRWLLSSGNRQTGSLELLLSVQKGTMYWYLDIKGKTMPENERMQGQ